MKMLVLALLLVCSAAQTTESLAQVIAQPEPGFPSSERGREGWVVLISTVDEDGIVVDIGIKDSSGSAAFNEAAIEALREWRFEPAERREISVLLNFVYGRSEVHLSRKFVTHIGEVHEAIGNGELDSAQENIDVFRNNENVTANELAYSLIAEARIASVRGDKAEQLRCFRRAIINQGHWLEADKYLMLLRTIVVLEVQLQDFRSALQTFDLLSSTRSGRKAAQDLVEPMKTIRAMVAGGGEFAPPWAVASIEMTVERKGRVLIDDVGSQGDFISETEDAGERPN